MPRSKKKINWRMVAVLALLFLFIIIYLFPGKFTDWINSAFTGAGLEPPLPSMEATQEFSLIMMLIITIVLVTIVFFSWGFWATLFLFLGLVAVAFYIKSLMTARKQGIEGNTSLNVNS